MKKKNKDGGRFPQKVRALRALCWGGLILLQLFLIHCLETQATMTACGTEGDEHKGIWHPEKEMVVERDITYEAVEELSEIPLQLSFSVEDEMDGRVTEVVCQAEEKRVLEEWWSPDFSFPVTFHECDAGFFQLADVLIPYEEDKPDLEGHEELLLELIGVPPEAYRVLDVAWDGELYRDQDGMVCRNAIATGEKRMRDYQVHYAGTAVFPETIAENSVTQTIQTPKPTSDSNADFQGEAEISGIPEDVHSERWKKLVQTITLAFRILFLLFILFMIILVIRKKMKYTDIADDNNQKEE